MTRMEWLAELKKERTPVVVHGVVDVEGTIKTIWQDRDIPQALLIEDVNGSDWFIQFGSGAAIEIPNQRPATAETSPAPVAEVHAAAAGSDFAPPAPPAAPVG